MQKAQKTRQKMPAQARRRIRVRGIVQGVGFRPFIYRLAHTHNLSGFVLNDAEGVLIEVEGPERAIDEFQKAIQAERPPLAQIDAVEATGIRPTGKDGFRIAESDAGQKRVALISPDMSTCSECLSELFDPADRRHRYPFINCTNCGPRYSIILDIPYDRPKTTMQQFKMCPLCQAEYDDPSSRRFHAQPNACPVCGPRLELRDADGKVVKTPEPVRAVRDALRAGKTVAIKGLTGFHLAADAQSDEAVRRLRQRKKRDQKPFAMMVASPEWAERICMLDPAGRRLLESAERPIVLLKKRAGSAISSLVAPKSPYFGVMLPYTPLHSLIFADEFGPLVMTSGNVSEEPICKDNDGAIERLREMADLYLLHNRPIETVCDDSVVRGQLGEPMMLRRGRGYAPRPIRLARKANAQILAVGPELKNCITLVRGDEAFVSQHIGDLKNPLASRYFEQTVEHLERLLEIRPGTIAYDLHPGYLSTRYAKKRQGVQLVAVQHHHAHIASVMAEHGLEGEVIGLACDGTGYGTDGAVWGCEILKASAKDFQRLGHLDYAPLIGGDAAIERPLRMAFGYLVKAYGKEAADLDIPAIAKVAKKDRQLWLKMTERGVNVPMTSGLGRLFDAVSALLGICTENTYEGQAAIELEAAAPPGTPRPVGVRGADEATGEAYPFNLIPEGDGFVISVDALVREVVGDLKKGARAGAISAKFHATVAEFLLASAVRVRDLSGLDRVALSGGCFQNDILVRHLVPMLEKNGFDVYLHRQVPPGDGCISLGQAYVAMHHMK